MNEKQKDSTIAAKWKDPRKRSVARYAFWFATMMVLTLVIGAGTHAAAQRDPMLKRCRTLESELAAEPSLAPLAVNLTRDVQTRTESGKSVALEKGRIMTFERITDAGAVLRFDGEPVAVPLDATDAEKQVEESRNYRASKRGENSVREEEAGPFLETGRSLSPAQAYRLGVADRTKLIARIKQVLMAKGADERIAGSLAPTEFEKAKYAVAKDTTIASRGKKIPEATIVEYNRGFLGE